MGAAGSPSAGFRNFRNLSGNAERSVSIDQSRETRDVTRTHLNRLRFFFRDAARDESLRDKGWFYY